MGSMEKIETYTETLVKLGLTPLEAKIFLVSIMVGRNRIEKISTVASIDRSNTHHTIKKLQELGLIAKIVAKPNLYEPIPLKNAINILIRKKEEEFKLIEKQARKIISLKGNTKLAEKSDFEFKIIKVKKDSLQQEVVNACNDVKQSFDLIISAKSFCDNFIHLSQHQLNCVKRGIKYRVILEEKIIQRYRKELQPFVEHSNFQLRSVTGRLPALIGMADKKNAYIILSTPVAMEKGVSQLITDNPSCVEMFQNHFEKVWSEAKENKNAALIFAEHQV